MLRGLVVVCALMACESRLPPPALPELVRPPPMGPIRVSQLWLMPGEEMAWSIQVNGITIGRAVLAIDDHEARSRFETDGLAAAFSRVHYDLVTGLGNAGPRWANERLVVDGERTEIAERFAGSRFSVGRHARAVPDGERGHTLHTALGVVRAWARPSAPAGYLYVVHAGALYRIDVARPLVEPLHGIPALRIELEIHAASPGATVLSPEDSIAVTVWLRERDRIPLRFEVANGTVHAAGELLDTGS